MKKANEIYVLMVVLGLLNSCKSNQETMPVLNKNCDYSIITPFTESDKASGNLNGNVSILIENGDTFVFDQKGMIINYPVFTEKDSLGRVISEISLEDTSFYFSEGYYNSGNSYEYDSAGRMKCEHISYPEGGSTVNYGCIGGLPAYSVNYEISLVFKKFNEKGFLIEEIEFEEEVEKIHKTYYRDLTNEIDRVETVKKSEYLFIFDETVVSHYKYKRDKRGNWIEMEIWENGKVVSTRKRVIEYFD